MVLWAINTTCVVVSCSITTVAVLRHLKNYRKPMDQRLIVRIMLMLPLFSISAWMELYGPRFLAGTLTFLREIYEAFVIYTFYSLLTSLLGGEREIIFQATGRPPMHLFGRKIDLSDPPTYLKIKQLVMQYVWMRPLVTVLSVIAPSWLQLPLIIIYNLSITLALNALMLFWVYLNQDLQPYRVALKFISVKLIVFFSYWQSLFLSILGHFGVMSAENLSLSKNSLMCIETVGFSVLHWYAFPVSDYASTVMFGFARLRLGAAIRDVFGITDLLIDFRSTFLGPRYGYVEFDSVEAVLDHKDSLTRQQRIAAGLRYRNGGRSKYWLPKSSLKKLLARTPQLSRYGSVSASPLAEPSAAIPDNCMDPGLDAELDLEAEPLYKVARSLYGDYNYPVVTVRESEEYVSYEDRYRRQQVLSAI